MLLPAPTYRGETAQGISNNSPKVEKLENSKSTILHHLPSNFFSCICTCMQVNKETASEDAELLSPHREIDQIHGYSDCSPGYLRIIKAFLSQD